MSKYRIPPDAWRQSTTVLIEHDVIDRKTGLGAVCYTEEGVRFVMFFNVKTRAPYAIWPARPLTREELLKDLRRWNHDRNDRDTEYVSRREALQMINKVINSNVSSKHEIIRRQFLKLRVTRLDSIGGNDD